jgi:hypothetical protein
MTSKIDGLKPIEITFNFIFANVNLIANELYLSKN